MDDVHTPPAEGANATGAAAAGPPDAAALTDVGTEREQNEDACGVVSESGATVVVVADGVSSANAGEVASRMAVEVVLRAYRDEPADRPAGQRLYRAVQQANIEIYDRAIVVPELRGMSTTLTAVAVEPGRLTAVHVGDSRLYLVRAGGIVQLTKDHTAAADRARLGLLSKDRARVHPDRSVLTRSVGRELIVSRDRISQPLAAGDVLVVCSDGLYNVLADEEIAEAVAERSAADACRALVDAANALGTGDNLTAAVVRIVEAAPAPPDEGMLARLRRRLRWRR